MKPAQTFLKVLVGVILSMTMQESTSLAWAGNNPALDTLLYSFLNPTPSKVLVAAHRGDWRNAPENSLQAVEYAYAMGVDFVELDVQMTADSQLILMHDKTLDRTTTGKGKIARYTLDTIKNLFLKNGAGMKTRYRVTTLREVMQYVKGKPLLVNIDKGWDCLATVYKVLKETGTINQAIFKGNESLQLMRKQWGAYMDSIMYMPMVWPTNYSIYKRDSIVAPLQYAQDFYDRYHPAAFEVIYDTETSTVFDAIRFIQSKHTTVWVNTLWDKLCADHDDELALANPDQHWGWVISHGANVIQTDRPQLLLAYLRSKGLHR